MLKKYVIVYNTNLRDRWDRAITAYFILSRGVIAYIL